MSQTTATPTIAKLWTRIVMRLLDRANKPVSTYRLLTDFAAEVVKSQTTKPNSTELLPNPDMIFLAWMRDKGIINEYTFNNRMSIYWGRGISVTYPNMNDDPRDDRPAVDAMSATGNVQTVGGVPIQRIQIPHPYPPPMLDPTDPDSQPENYDNFVRDINQVTMSGLISDIQTLKQTVNTLESRIQEMEDREGIQRKKPKTPKTRAKS